MAWTTAENNRVGAIELIMNKIQTAITKLATQAQLRSLSALKQNEISDLQTRVQTLENQVAILQKNSI